MWALGRWPGCPLHCHEPLQAILGPLRKNLGRLERSRVRLHPRAIGRPGWRRLDRGRNNRGEAGFFDLGEQTVEWLEVDVRPPEVLPPAQVIRLDTDGAEIEVLVGLTLIDFDVVLIEYQSEANRRAADARPADYVLRGGSVRSPHHGSSNPSIAGG